MTEVKQKVRLRTKIFIETNCGFDETLMIDSSHDCKSPSKQFIMDHILVEKLDNFLSLTFHTCSVFGTLTLVLINSTNIKIFGAFPSNKKLITPGASILHLLWTHFGSFTVTGSDVKPQRCSEASVTAALLNVTIKVKM